MAIALKNLVRYQAYSIIRLQLIGLLVVIALALLLHGLQSASAVALGALAYVLPNLIFVWRVFRHTGANAIVRFISAFFIGETLKLIFSAILVLLIVKYLALSLLSVLIGFIAAIMLFWIACIVYFSKRNSK